MTIAAFDPAAALAGGALIGVAAGALALLNGRIAGISGIVGGLLTGGSNNSGERGWRVAFIMGLLLAPFAWRLWAAYPAIVAQPAPVLVVAGLLVGVGTRYGAGCTSGHGVCGIARLSRRSLAATIVFMAAAMLTVFVARHVLGVG
jgi:uncharacterized membrane protein YedE/YeeE